MEMIMAMVIVRKEEWNEGNDDDATGESYLTWRKQTYKETKDLEKHTNWILNTYLRF
jgi:hypothetical protein